MIADRPTGDPCTHPMPGRVRPLFGAPAKARLPADDRSAGRELREGGERVGGRGFLNDSMGCGPAERWACRPPWAVSPHPPGLGMGGWRTPLPIRPTAR